MIYNYTLNTFVYFPSEGIIYDKVIKIYDKNRVHKYSIDPNIAYFYYKNNLIYIKVEDEDTIILDFETNAIAIEALTKLNTVKKEIFASFDADQDWYTKTELNNGQLDNRYYNTGLTYNKTEIGNFLSGKTDVVDFDSHTGDTTIHYTKESILLDNLGDVNTGGTIQGYYLSYSAGTWVGIEDSTDLSNYYNKQQVYNTGETYTQTEVDYKIIEAATGVSFTDFAVHTATTNAHWVTFDNLVSTAHTHLTEDVIFTGSGLTAIEVGGIAEGTDLYQQNVYEILDLMMYPELFPTLTNPSSTFTDDASTLQEIGDVISIIFTSSFNRGSISPQYYSSSPYRSGLPNTYTYTGYGLYTSASTETSNIQTATGYTVILGTQSWTNSVSYDIGIQPKSNKDNDYSTPLPSGITSIDTTYITGVYPYFATTVDISTMTQQSLASHGSTVITWVVAEGVAKQSVEFPDAWGSIGTLQQYNTLSGLYDTIDLSTFTVTVISKTINGNNIDYNKYTHNGGLIGARGLKWIV